MKLTFLLLLLLSACVRNPEMAITTLKIDRSTLASFHTDCYDLNLANPAIGQRLLISWRLKKVEDHRIEGTLIYRDYTQEDIAFTVERPYGYFEKVLIDEEYLEKKGILAYQFFLYKRDTLLEEQTHPLFCPIIAL